MAQTYRVSKSNRIVLAIFLGLVFVLGGIFMLVYPYFENPPKPPGAILFFNLFGLGMIFGALFVIRWTVLFRIEIESGFLRVRGVFGEREIPFKDIRGFAVIGGRSIAFYGENSKKLLGFRLLLDNEREFLRWAEQNFKNERTEAANRERETAMANESLGADEAQRQDTLNRARQFAKGLGFAGMGFGLWAMVYPRPYTLVVGILMLLPAVAIFAVLFSRGAIRFNVRKDSTYATADPSFLAALFLAFRATKDWDVLDWSHFWLPFAVITLALFTLLVIGSESARTNGGSVLMVLVLTAIYGFGVTLTSNGILDPSQPSTYESQVVAKRISRGSKSTTYYLTLAPWGPVQTTKDYEISLSSYQRHETGDKVTVDLHEGALHIPYCFIY